MAAGRVNRPSTSSSPSAISTTGRARPTTSATSYGQELVGLHRRGRTTPARSTFRAPATTSTTPRHEPGQEPDEVEDRRVRGSRSPDRAQRPAIAHSGGQLGGQRAQRVRPLGRGRGVDQAAHQRGPDDDAVGEGGHLGGLGAGGDPEPDADRQVGDRAGARHEGAGGVADAGAGAGDAHRGGRVDEAAAGRAGRWPAARRSTTAPRGRPGRGRCARLAAIHVLGLVGDEVGGDQPGAAGRGEVGGEPVDAVAHDGVPVGHHEGRRARVGHGADGGEHVGEAGRRRASAASAACWMTGPSISGSL